MTPIRNRPSPEGEEFGRHLARLTETAIPAAREAMPELPARCGTCAYRAGTLPNRCLATAADALKAAVEMSPFLCHEREAAPGELAACSGWAAWVLAAADRMPAEMPYDFVGGVD